MDKRLLLSVLMLSVLAAVLPFSLSTPDSVRAATTCYEQFTSANAGSALYGTTGGLYQTFSPLESHYFDTAAFCLYKTGSPT